MDTNFNIPTIITKRNTDSSGNPISVKLIEVRQIMDNYSCIVLSQTPDELNRIYVEGFTEVFDIEKLDKKNFKVDYNQGVVYFHPFNIGKAVTLEYYGIGYQLISASKVFTKVDKYGNIIDTLEGILERADLQLKLVESLGGAIKVIEKLDVNIKNANALNSYFDEKIPEVTEIKNELDAVVTDVKGWKDQLHIDVQQGKELQPLLHNDIIQGNATKEQLEQTIANAQDDINKIEATGNEIVYITSSEWVYNDISKTYEKQITHTCNSENIHVTCKTSDTKEVLFLPWRIVDKSNVLLKSDEAVNISVVISARYYKPLINNTTTQEVINARKGENSLLDKINSIDDSINSNSSKLEEKVNKTEETLETTNKDIVGAINEINKKTNVEVNPLYVSSNLTSISSLTSKNVSYFYSLYDGLVNKYPHLLSSNTLGKDQSGSFDIKQYIYTPSSGFNNTVLITGGVHGDEKAYPYLIYEMLKLIVLDDANSYYFKDVRDKTRFIIIPLCNPWGIENSKRQNSRNVDINRNFDHKWSSQESECSNPSGTRYKGTAPFSEKESQYIRDVMNNNNLSAYIDMHNFVENNANGFMMYYSVATENISKEIVSIMKRQYNEKAEFYVQGADSCAANYAESVKKLPSMTLEAVRVNGNIGDNTILNKFMTLGFNHLLYYARIGFTRNTFIIDNINIENTDNSTDTFPKNTNLVKISKYDKSFNFSKNGILIVSGSINSKVVASLDSPVSAKSVSIDARILENGSDVSNRLGAVFSSGFYSGVMSFNYTIPIKANTPYNFELWGCYDGVGDNYTAYLKRVKVSFTFMSQ